MIRIAMYRGTGLLAWLVRLRTGGHYSHCSLVVVGVRVIEALPFTGVVESDLSRLQEADLFDFAHTREQAVVIAEFASRQVGKAYDLLAILSLFVAHKEDRKKTGKWFCSELVVAALRKAGVNATPALRPWEVTPQRLAESPLLCPSSDASPPSGS